MNTAFQRLLGALRTPESLCHFSEPDWDALLRHTRAAGLMSRLALEVESQQCWTTVPAQVRGHMRAALFVAQRQSRAVTWEVHQVCRALDELNIPVILLKGAAYVMGDLPPARGRLFGDIDLLVPKDSLPAVESQLMLHGWHGIQHSPYDQRYYRQWMHEIPPLKHFTRGSVLDVHHNILPSTARLKPSAAHLISGRVPVEGYRNLYRLGDTDLVLHSAAHLFHEGEWGHGLRDLVDLDALLRHFGTSDAFWDDLLIRADILDLRRPLAYALRYAHTLLDTPIPSPLLAHTRRDLGKLPWLMDWLFIRGFMSAHPELASATAGMACFALYVRSHWLRMPVSLLVPHLLHKTRGKD